MKNKGLTAILVIIAFTVGHFMGDSSAVNRVNEDINTRVANSVNEGKPKEEETIKLDDIPVEIVIREPDSIGTVYMDASFTNNTDYPITYYSVDVLLKDSNETGSLSTFDTVMPGETSPKFNSFGPNTGKEEDYEIIGIEVRAEAGENKTLNLEHDAKLNRTKIEERENN